MPPHGPTPYLLHIGDIWYTHDTPVPLCTTYAPCRPPMAPNIYFYHPSSHSQDVISFSSVDLIWSGFDLILS